jgi:hypothetical protein
LRIDPDGTVLRFDTATAMNLANAEFDYQCDVVTLRAPFFPEDDIHVGFVHDFGAMNGMPINRVAWSCYGRSPVFGPMYVQNDERTPIDPAIIATIEAGVPADLAVVMDAWLNGHGMRENGTWPL